MEHMVDWDAQDRVVAQSWILMRRQRSPREPVDNPIGTPRPAAACAPNLPVCNQDGRANRHRKTMGYAAMSGTRAPPTAYSFANDHSTATTVPNHQ